MGVTNFDKVSGDVEIAASHSGSGSYQPVAADLTVAAAAGSGTETDPKYIAPIMGNVMGADLSKDSNVLAGIIGKYNVSGEQTSKYPRGGVIGEVGEEHGNPTRKADGAVVAVIGGDSARVNPRAYFAARHLNSNSGSGPEYGVDLYDPEASGLSYGQGAPSIAAIRFPNGLLFVTLDTAITANSTTTSAPAGSLAITSHNTGKNKIFQSDGTKWQYPGVA